MNRFTFKPLAETDIDRMHRWLNQAHVLEYWPEPLSLEQVRAKYLKHIASNIVFPFIAYFNDQAIAYIHYYAADKVGGGWWPDARPGTVGIDLFIGELDFIHKGYGSALLKEFIDQLTQNSAIKRLIIDVNPKNITARRCYEKVGFIAEGEVNTPDGLALLMAIDIFS
ncbi:MAG: GNAT family N-acetyltransferase [Gammaproteobacteria bacterium]|nr:GNAT family N-acetyltransferase [Gammaproteobacteria bacterium]